MQKFLNNLVFEALRYNTSSFILFARHRAECIKYGLDSYTKLHSKLSPIYSRMASLWNGLHDNISIYTKQQKAREVKLYAKFRGLGLERNVPAKLMSNKPLDDKSPPDCSFSDNLAENAYYHAKLLHTND